MTTPTTRAKRGRTMESRQSNKRGRTRTSNSAGPPTARMHRFEMSTSSSPADVEIDILGELFQVHSVILSSSSEFFSRSLSERWWRPENTHDGPDGVRYRYKFVPDDDSGYMGTFEPLLPSKSTTAENNAPKWMQKLTSDDVLHVYHAIFGSFYHRRLTPDEPDVTTDHETLDRIDRILDVADFLGCMPTVAVRVEAFLHTWCWELGPNEAGDNSWDVPEPWGERIGYLARRILPLSVRIHSPVIFHESFVHFVGRLVKLQGFDMDNEKAYELLESFEDALAKLPPALARHIRNEQRRIQWLAQDALHAALLMTCAAKGESNAAFRVFMESLMENSRNTDDLLNVLHSAGTHRFLDQSWTPEVKERWSVFWEGSLKDLFASSLARKTISESDEHYYVCAHPPMQLPWEDTPEW